MKTLLQSIRQKAAAYFLALVLAASFGLPAVSSGQTAPRVVEVLADHDSRFKIAGEAEPVITAKPGEPLLLRITAKKAKNHNRDGSVHGFALLRAGDREPVPGWDFLLKRGTQDFQVTAPRAAGEYVVVCTVICSKDHEQMNLKFVVAP